MDIALVWGKGGWDGLPHLSCYVSGRLGIFYSSFFFFLLLLILPAFPLLVSFAPLGQVSFLYIWAEDAVSVGLPTIHPGFSLPEDSTGAEAGLTSLGTVNWGAGHIALCPVHFCRDSHLDRDSGR